MMRTRRLPGNEVRPRGVFWPSKASRSNKCGGNETKTVLAGCLASNQPTEICHRDCQVCLLVSARSDSHLQGKRVRLIVWVW